MPKFIISVVSPALLFLFQLSPSGRHDARPGEIAAGEVMPSNGPNLMLNTSPCSPTPTIVYFHDPYRKVRAERASCNGREYERLQVEQEN